MQALRRFITAILPQVNVDFMLRVGQSLAEAEDLRCFGI
jgi:hypothetical protein